MNIDVDNRVRGLPPTDRRSPDYSPDDMRSMVSDSFCSMDYQVIPGSLSPTSRLSGIDLGGIHVFRHDGIGKRVGCRSAKHIRQHWVDHFVISMPLNARVTTRQGGHMAHLDADSFVILSTTQPFDAEFSSSDPMAVSSTFLVRISGSLLRQRVPTLDRYCGMPLKIGAGSGRIMRGMFELALGEGQALSDARQVDRFSNMLLDAVTNVATELPARYAAPDMRQSSYERIRDQAMACIHDQLTNPELSVQQIAQHCGISARHLQAAFADAGISAISYIRETRLQQCRAFLKNPETRRMSVIDIAMRWGFNDAPYFSRAYKARFGKPPSADRT